jgi:predicted alpha/beta-fold hydrolase
MFRPNPLVRSANVQTLLSLIRPRGIDITDDEQPLLVDAGEDLTGAAPERPVRLLGYYNSSRLPGVWRGLVLLLHGWEGCSHSNYNLVLAQRLVEQGFSTFRLNLRDHGPNLHIDPYSLNPGNFRGTSIEEVAAATAQIAQLLAGPHPFDIAGASLGGNFALRLRPVAQRANTLSPSAQSCGPLPGHSPRPCYGCAGPQSLTRSYFRRRWLRSLHAKQALYPGSARPPCDRTVSLDPRDDRMVRPKACQAAVKFHFATPTNTLPRIRCLGTRWPHSRVPDDHSSPPRMTP